MANTFQHDTFQGDAFQEPDAPLGTEVGVRSLLAFWIGGAGVVAGEPPEPGGGGGVYIPVWRPRRR